jgi:hypothetical protein
LLTTNQICILKKLSKAIILQIITIKETHNKGIPVDNQTSIGMVTIIRTMLLSKEVLTSMGKIAIGIITMLL